MSVEGGSGGQWERSPYVASIVCNQTGRGAGRDGNDAES